MSLDERYERAKAAWEEACSMYEIVMCAGEHDYPDEVLAKCERDLAETWENFRDISGELAAIESAADAWRDQEAFAPFGGL